MIYGPYKMWGLTFNRTVNIPCVIQCEKSIPHDAPVCGQVTRTYLSLRVQLRVCRKMAANAWPSASLSVPDKLELMQSVASVAALPVRRVPGTLFLEVNLQVREADH
jgi:hypothetical protein